MKYSVNGMSCAACQARVEKAVSKVNGVTSCSVSLLTNSMGVEGTADSTAIIKAVEDAGYGASLKEDAHGAAVKTDDDLLKDTETPKLKKRTSTPYRPSVRLPNTATPTTSAFTNTLKNMRVRKYGNTFTKYGRL